MLERLSSIGFHVNMQQAEIKIPSQFLRAGGDGGPVAGGAPDGDFRWAITGYIHSAHWASSPSPAVPRAQTRLGISCSGNSLAFRRSICVLSWQVHSVIVFLAAVRVHMD